MTMASSYTFEIAVLQEDIDNAMKKSSSHCALAEAIKQEVPEAKFIAVDIQTIRFSIADIRYVFLTPRAAQRSIIDFDAGQMPKPFTLKLKGGQRTKRHSIAHGKGGDGVFTRPSSGRLPVIKGGRTPPTAKTRREFGLRAFDR